MANGIRKRILFIVLLMTVILLTASLCRVPFKASAAELSDNAVIALSGKVDGETVSVDAYLYENTGLSTLSVELIYDADAMTLENVEQGGALSSRHYMTTDVNTEKGYGINPFRINYFYKDKTPGRENDKSTGLLFNMKFSVKENIQDGKYTVTLKTLENNPPTYFEDGEDKPKKALINGVQVEIKGSKPQTVEEEIPETSNKPSALLWISISVAAVAVSGLVVLTVIKIKGKRSWTKVE